jgi:hypothetical protein
MESRWKWHLHPQGRSIVFVARWLQRCCSRITDNVELTILVAKCGQYYCSIASRAFKHRTRDLPALLQLSFSTVELTMGKTMKSILVFRLHFSLCYFCTFVICSCSSPLVGQLWPRE